MRRAIAPTLVQVLSAAAADAPRARASGPTNPLSTQRSPLSQPAAQWMSEVRYGSDEAPVFGSFGITFSDGALTTRQLYCKALVYASGGGRRARDWIAGCTAMSSPNQTLLSIALQYTATEADIAEFRQHMLARLLVSDGVDGSGARRAEGSGTSRSWQDPLTAPRHGDDAASKASTSPAANSAESHSSGSPPHGATATVADDGVAYEDDDDEATRLMRRLAHQLTKGETGGYNSSSASVSPTQGDAGPSASTTQREENGSDTSTKLESSRNSNSSSDTETPTASAALPPDTTEAATPSSHFTSEEIKAAEDCLLSASPEIRCFLYDAMTASLFHCHGDVAIVEDARRRVFRLGTLYFGFDESMLRPLWRIVEAELIVRKEKLRMLGQPWGE